jgi:DNA-binding MarR family transcriptional regulator
MPNLLIKDLPRYECLQEAASQFPELDPSAVAVFLHLLRTGDEAFRVADETLSRHAISQGRFVVLLSLLDKSKNCPTSKTPAELADHAGVTRATMTGLVDTLERDGLVTRAPDPDDRRMMSVQLTPKGEGRLQAILPDYFQRIAALMKPLSENERKTLLKLLLKVLHHAETLGASSGVDQAATKPTAAAR